MVLGLGAPSAALAGGPVLDVTGECGSEPITLTVTNAGGSHEIAFMRSNGEGTAVMPTQCTGTPLNLAGPRLKLIGIEISDASGGASVTVNVPEPACEVVTFQAIDMGTCTTTNTQVVP